MSAAPRRLPFARLLFAVIAGFVLAASVGSGALFAYQGRYTDRIYPGVRVAGLDVAGLDRDAASALLDTALARYGAGSVVITAGTHTVELSDADLGRRVDIEGLLDEAFAVGRFADPMGNAADGVRTLVNGHRHRAPRHGRCRRDGPGGSGRRVQDRPAARRRDRALDRSGLQHDPRGDGTGPRATRPGGRDRATPLGPGGTCADRAHRHAGPVAAVSDRCGGSDGRRERDADGARRDPRGRQGDLDHPRVDRARLDLVRGDPRRPVRARRRPGCGGSRAHGAGQGDQP